MKELCSRSKNADGSANEHADLSSAEHRASGDGMIALMAASRAEKCCLSQQKLFWSASAEWCVRPLCGLYSMICGSAGMLLLVMPDMRQAEMNHFNLRPVITTTLWHQQIPQ